MSLSKSHQVRIKLICCRSTCRHIRIIGPHYLHPAQIHLFKSLKIRSPSVILSKTICEYLCLNQLRSRRVSRIAGVRNKHLVTLVQKCQRYQQDAFLRAYQGLNFGRWVKINSVPSGIPSGKGLSKFRQSHITLVGMIPRLDSRLTQGFDSSHRRHTIR